MNNCLHCLHSNIALWVLCLPFLADFSPPTVLKNSAIYFFISPIQGQQRSRVSTV